MKVNIISHKKIILTWVVIVMIAWLAHSCIMSNFFFKTTFYTIEDSRITSPIRIVHLTDVHNNEFGDNNKDLITEVELCKPDLIFVTGDSVNHDEENTDSAISLVKQLTSIAPVYFSYGNHEVMNEEKFGTDIGALMEAAGARVLDFSYEDVDINGQPLRIGGIYGYCLPEKYLETDEANPVECDFLNEFQNTDRFTMLLAHMPYSWIEHDAISEWNVEAVFAGHSHGGQMVIPFLGPVYAPDQGWFPDWVSGHFVSSDGEKDLIVSTGLGNSTWVPRVNNEMEVVVVDVK